MNKFCGFVVVRTPKCAKAPYHQPNSEINSNYYNGIDRLQWEDLKQRYYSKKLPLSLHELHRQIKLQESELFGIQITRDYQLAERALKLNPEASEIIAIYSPELEGRFGVIDGDTYRISLNHIGYDCFSIGEWSLILRGMFARPAEFSLLVNRLNRWGLFENCDDCRLLEVEYLELSRSEIVEPLQDQPKFSCISIYSTEEQRD
jgi:hypothetical protein